MRIAIVIDGLGGVGGGVATYLRTLVPALLERGAQPVLIAGQPADDPPAGAPYLVVPDIDADRPTLPPAVRSRLAATLADVTPDVCYLHVISPDASRAAAEQAPTVFYAHEYLTVCLGGSRYLHRQQRFCSEGPGLHCLWRAYTDRTANRRPDRLANAYRRVRGWRETWSVLAGVLVASPFVGDVLVRSGAPAELVHVVPYPVPAVAPSSATPATDVLFLGRLTPEKGVHVLLEALAQLGGATAVIAGDGPERHRLEREAAARGLAERVRFVGWVSLEQRARLLADAGALAITSLWEEPFGIVGLEALTAGVPVVASAVGGIPFWLDDGGRLVPPGDAGALAAALRDVLAEGPGRESLRTAGRLASERFSVARHADDLLAVFARAAG